MKTEDIILICAAAGAGYLIYKGFNKPLSPAEYHNSWEQAGYEAQVIPAANSLTGKTGVSVLVPGAINTTYLFSEADVANENIAQRILRSIGVPARWIYG